MKIKKIIETDTAHRLLGDLCDVGKCGHIHGHRYKFEIEIESDNISDVGYIINFSDIKKLIMENYDHRLVINRMDLKLMEFLDRNNMKFKIIEGNPTAENFAMQTVDAILELFSSKVILKSIRVRVWETPSCYAESIYESS